MSSCVRCNIGFDQRKGKSAMYCPDCKKAINKAFITERITATTNMMANADQGLMGDLRTRKRGYIKELQEL